MTQNKHIGIIILLASAIALGGCAKEKAFKPSGPVGPTPPPSDGGRRGIPPGGGGGTTPPPLNGDEAFLVVSNKGAFEDYAGHSVNDPKNGRVQFDLRRYGNGYGGRIRISYEDGGSRFVADFTSLVRSGATVKDNETNNRYNIWHTWGSKFGFHGFFEDERPSVYFRPAGQAMGGLVVVMDSFYDAGDGSGPEGTAGGSLWYKNFRFEYSPLSPTSCWFVTAGPYDCRSWPVGDSVNTYQALYPNNGYQKFAEFYGVNLDEAFNGSLPF